MATNKPSNISSKIWASLGDLEAPTEAKLETGWGAEVPKAQIENWVQNRQDAFNAHVNERGIPEWDATTDYIPYNSYVQGSNGFVYQCIIASGPSTTPRDPISNTVNGYWVQAFVTGSQGIQFQNRLNVIEYDVDNKQDILVSGSNIKTVNGQPLLGSGDLEIPEGDVTGAINVGPGTGVFKEKVDEDLIFKSLVGVGGVSIYATADEIQISAASSGQGVMVFATEADIPEAVELEPVTLGYIQATKELMYTDGEMWNIFAIQRSIPGGQGVDPYFNNVSLLLRGDVLPLVDSSLLVNNITGTNVSVSNTAFRYGAGSISFNGIDSIVTVPHNSNLSFAAGDFTLEMWIRPTNIDAGCLFLHRSAQDAVGVSVIIQSGGILAANFGNTAAGWEVQLLSSTPVVKESWQHVAISRSGTSFKMFLNGTEVADATSSVSIADTSGLVRIGAAEGGNYYNGFLDDIRVTKGVARYTEDFIPPGPMGQDAEFSNVQLLLHMDSLPLKDYSANNFTITNNSVAINNSVVKYGTGSAQFNGASNFVIPHNANLSFGGGDFTIETWIRLPTASTGTQVLMTHRPTQTATGVNIYVQNMTLLAFFGDSSTSAWEVTMTSNQSFMLDTWQHVAITRAGNTFLMFLDGVKVAEATSPVIINDVSGDILIGRSEPGNYLNGYLDDFRITKGVARYVGNFTPPVSELPNN